MTILIVLLRPSEANCGNYLHQVSSIATDLGLLMIPLTTGNGSDGIFPKSDSAGKLSKNKGEDFAA
jgi:hypothetical protein